VILSSKRIPTANKRSERSIARLTDACPCIPGQPKYSGWSSGKALMPSSVVTTGMPVLSASSRSSISAPESVTPWPARMIGRFAFRRSIAARSSPGDSTGAGASRSRLYPLSLQAANCTSLGTSTRTGPGLPLRAISNARRIVG
jgi:hypothetical protein